MSERSEPKPGDCVACPVEVRGLFACAANAGVSFDALMRGQEDAERFYRKMAELAEAVQTMRPLIEAHFADKAHAGTALP